MAITQFTGYGMTAELLLRKPLRKTIAEGHPWIFRKALLGKMPKAGSVTTVLDEKKHFVARGLAENGAIGVRVFCTRDEPLDQQLFQRRVTAAASLRKSIIPADTNTYRLLHGEGDRLPGIVCDVYDRYAVLGFDGQAAPRWQNNVVAALRPVLKQIGVKHLLHKQGRGEKREVTCLIGQLPRSEVEVLERGMRLKADLLLGQKTGLFLDHRESRYRVRSLAKGRNVLNLYGYTGGFSVACGLAGAKRVTTVDSAKPACQLAHQSWLDNGLNPNQHTIHATTVQAFLDQASSNALYDLIICDPPSFAPSEDRVKKAKRAYTAVHRQALTLLAPGGLYLAASCSSHIRHQAFEQTLLDACQHHKHTVQVLERWGAPADHPRLAAFPEGDYLTVSLIRLVD